MSRTRMDKKGLFFREWRRDYPVIDHAKGIYLYGADGKRYLDAAGGVHVVGIGHGVRPDHGRAHPGDRGEAAPPDEPGADCPISRAQLLPSLLTRPAAGHGRPGCRMEHLRPDPEIPPDRAGWHPTACIRSVHHRMAGRQACSPHVGGAWRRECAPRPGRARPHRGRLAGDGRQGRLAPGQAAAPQQAHAQAGFCGRATDGRRWHSVWPPNSRRLRVRRRG